MSVLEPEKAVDEAVERLAEALQELAQERANIETVLYANDRDDEWKRKARLEYELSYEQEFLERAIEQLKQRLAPRKAIVEEQREQRRHSWEQGSN